MPKYRVASYGAHRPLEIEAISEAQARQIAMTQWYGKPDFKVPAAFALPQPGVEDHLYKGLGLRVEEIG